LFVGQRITPSGREVNFAPFTPGSGAQGARRRAILAVLIDKVVCRPTESYVRWREPFGMLIGMNRLSEEKLKGE